MPTSVHFFKDPAAGLVGSEEKRREEREGSLLWMCSIPTSRLRFQDPLFPLFAQTEQAIVCIPMSILLSELANGLFVRLALDSYTGCDSVLPLSWIRYKFRCLG